MINSALLGERLRHFRWWWRWQYSYRLLSVIPYTHLKCVRWELTLSLSLILFVLVFLHCILRSKKREESPKTHVQAAHMQSHTQIDKSQHWRGTPVKVTATQHTHKNKTQRYESSVKLCTPLNIRLLNAINNDMQTHFSHWIY